MADTDRHHFLDTGGARAVAMLCCLAALGTLAYLHRDDLFPPDAPVASAADAAFVACFAERGGAIERMVAEGSIGADRAALFKTRAEAFCRAQAGP